LFYIIQETTVKAAGEMHIDDVSGHKRSS
jgi:hypothetical protein